MFKLLISALYVILQFIFRGIVVKFLAFWALFYITTEFIPLAIEMFIPKSLNLDLNKLFELLPDSVWYFLLYLKLDYGISLVFAAYISRFIIRRLPIVG